MASKCVENTQNLNSESCNTHTQITCRFETASDNHFKKCKPLTRSSAFRTHTHTHACIHTQTQTHTYIHTYIDTNAHIHTYINVHIHTYINIHI